jgi:peptidoglycan-associated lipoprotein
MHLVKNGILVGCLALLGLTTGCQRTGGDCWEDAKTGSRHISRGVKSFGGKCGDSRSVQNASDFYCYDENGNLVPMPVGQDFVPISDQPMSDEVAMADFVARQPSQIPGDPGSSIPGIESFRDPATMPELAGTFRNISFEYNSYLIRGDDNSETIRKVSNYMNSHPNTYIFVEGHCDERGAEAFNLALGARRSNAVRNDLLANGVNPDNVFTISYGKERPLVMESHEEAWSKNRRAEFKVYQK